MPQKVSIEKLLSVLPKDIAAVVEKYKVELEKEETLKEYKKKVKPKVEDISYEPGIVSSLYRKYDEPKKGGFIGYRYDINPIVNQNRFVQQMRKPKDLLVIKDKPFVYKQTEPDFEFDNELNDFIR